MTQNFSQVVEEIKQLSTEEKQELQELLEKLLIEERRQEILANYQESLKQLQDNQLTFSSDTEKLQDMLSHD